MIRATALLLASMEVTALVSFAADVKGLKEQTKITVTDQMIGLPLATSNGTSASLSLARASRPGSARPTPAEKTSGSITLPPRGVGGFPGEGRAAKSRRR